MNKKLLSATADVALVAVFCAIGRHSHDEAVVAGLLRTLWPFLTGLAAGWLVVAVVTRGRFASERVYPSGLAAWLGTLVGGMLLRLVSGQGVALSFIIVAATVLAVFLLGWRGAYRLFQQ